MSGFIWLVRLRQGPLHTTHLMCKAGHVCLDAPIPSQSSASATASASTTFLATQAGLKANKFCNDVKVNNDLKHLILLPSPLHAGIAGV